MNTGIKLLKLLTLLLFITACNSKPVTKNHKKPIPAKDASMFIGKVPAPAFPKGLAWLNTKYPITLKELRGKVVLLDFWTYGCINCYHVFPTLDRLQKEFPNTLVIIGVHSAKFQSSKLTSNIRQTILRFGLHHPVVNDRNFKIWNSYGINAWPSFILIDPDGNVVGKMSGEGIYSTMYKYISGIIKVFGAEGKLNRKPLHFTPVSQNVAQSVLYFPGKVFADGKNKRLYISDTDHNRIVVTTLGGKVEYTIGNGNTGFTNGSYSKAEFNQPQGVTVIGDTLYVADTGNHAIRKVNLSTEKVTTLAGDGHEARRFNVPGKGTHVALDSPWGITSVNGELYVAMAGSHQVWKVNPETGYAKPFAGTGAEGLQEGNRNSIPMAQPSGIVSDGPFLYVAEPEASAVQKIGLGNDTHVSTIVGKGLFTFGDVDGQGGNVRLQHVQGIALWKGKLIIADTYNNKIKIINPDTKTCKTLFGNGKAGHKDGTGTNTEFNEPAGLSVLGNTVYIADTDNQLIRKANLITHKVTTLTLTNLKKLTMTGESDDMTPQNVITLKPIRVKAGVRNLTLNIRLPKGYQFNEEATSRFIIKSNNTDITFNGKNKWIINKPNFPSEVRIKLVPNSNPELILDVFAFYCEETKQSFCLYKSIRYKIPLEVKNNGSDHISISPELPKVL